MGFLSGLSNLAGGAMGGLKSAGSGLLDNMLPLGAVSQTAGADLGAVPQGLPGAGEQLTAAPSIQTHGLLERMGTPDARGMNMGDKLMAASLMMQGDTAGAADFMHQQRASADVLQQRQLQQDTAKAGLEAMRKNINPDGSLNVQGYLAALPAGADPMEGLKLSEAARPKFERMSGAGGSIYEFDPHKSGGTQVVAGTKPLINPDGTLNEDVLAAQATAKERLAAAQRAGAPLAPHVGRAGRAAAGPQIPTGYRRVN